MKGRQPIRQIRKLLPQSIMIVTGEDLKKPIRLYCYSHEEERQVIDQFGKSGRNIDIFYLPKNVRMSRCRIKYTQGEA